MRLYTQQHPYARFASMRSKKKVKAYNGAAKSSLVEPAPPLTSTLAAQSQPALN